MTIERRYRYKNGNCYEYDNSGHTGLSGTFIPDDELEKIVESIVVCSQAGISVKGIVMEIHSYRKGYK
jgi:hypothetical protein